MKKTKKLTSLLLACMMLMSLCVPAMATKSLATDQTNTGREALLINASYRESVFLDDGTEIIFAVVPMAATRTGTTVPSGWAQPVAVQQFQCLAANGNYLNVRTENIGETTMSVEDAIYDGSGDFVASVEREVLPGDAFITYTDGSSDVGLTIKVVTTITAVNSSSANYSYTAHQSWVLASKKAMSEQSGRTACPAGLFPQHILKGALS